MSCPAWRLRRAATKRGGGWGVLDRFHAFEAALKRRGRARLTDGRKTTCTPPPQKDRTTPIGQMIDSYLKSQVDMDDHVIHLLFSANRWEAAYGSRPYPV